MGILLLFSLLSALLAPGNSLQCYDCLSFLGPCDGSLTTCGPSDDTYVNVITSYKLLGKSGTLRAKSCLEETSHQIRPFVATFQPDSSLRINFSPTAMRMDATTGYPKCQPRSQSPMVGCVHHA
ncbi:hypothetical protein Y1Q_0016044 [Alligator mississippiensis]|uniref:Uncharacterized protein n=1 Tax=Alligator mississippiensis TaxID=8496 RepID=A0A151MW30_ALLMI|nr:hypothetical protein Y1Q_0016044 [Alligator mississippiensis]